MAFVPGFVGDFGPCFPFSEFCDTSTSTQQPTTNPTTANSGTTVIETSNTTPTSQSTRNAPSPAHSASHASSSDPAGASTHSTSKAKILAPSLRSSPKPSPPVNVTSSSSSLPSAIFITVPQSITATLTETTVTTDTGALGSQSSGTPSRGTVIGVAVGGGVSFLLVMIGAIMLHRRIRRYERPVGHVPTFRFSQFVLNSSDSKEPLPPDFEDARFAPTATSPTSSSPLSPLPFTPLSPSRHSLLSPALTATSPVAQSFAFTRSFAAASPVHFAAEASTSPTWPDPLILHPGSPPPSSEEHPSSPSDAMYLAYDPEENVREVDAGSVPPSVYGDLEGIYGSLQERAAMEPLPPAYDTLPARRPAVTVRTDAL